jgi:hypothetical protein
VVVALQYLASIAMAMATAPLPLPDPLPLSAPDFPRLVAAYLPSPSSEDDAADGPSSLDDDSPDSLDDWSDDRPDSADDYDHTSDSDDSSLAWNTSKSKKHLHPHPHPHPHPHLHHKKNSFHSACDYLSFFGALRKGFCSRHLDQRYAPLLSSPLPLNCFFSICISLFNTVGVAFTR